jgi:Methyltransferase domain
MDISRLKVAVRGAARRLGIPDSARRAFGNEWYTRHNQRRQEHLASLGLDVFSKTVLETGAGVGDHTSFFLDRGCHVTITEPRAENLAMLRRRYPAQEVVALDLDNPTMEFGRSFEVVYCYGTLYHLSKPAIALEYLAKQCSGMTLLETCVSPGDSLAINVVAEPVRVRSQAFSGFGCRPTREWVFSELRRYFPHVYVPLTQPAHPEFPLDWSAVNGPALTRAVFVASREALSNPLLMESLPDRQYLSAIHGN